MATKEVDKTISNFFLVHAFIIKQHDFDDFFFYSKLKYLAVHLDSYFKGNSGECLIDYGDTIFIFSFN
jgi:hypothetical protein